MPTLASSGGTRGSAGGSQTGQLIGAAIGGAVGGLGGAAAGSSLGGMAGNAIDPAKQGQEAMARQVQAEQPQLVHSENSDALKQSIMALHEAPQPIRDEYGPQLVHAYLTSLHTDNVEPQQGALT